METASGDRRERHRREGEQAALESARLAQLAAKLAGVGYWRWHVATDEVEWSDVMLTIYGCTRETAPRTAAEVMARFHPDNAERLGELMAKAIEGAPGPTVEYEARNENGAPLVLVGQCQPEVDAQVRTVGLVGTCMDITERRRAEHELRMNEARFRLLAENANDVIGRIGLEGETLYVTPSAEKVLGYPTEYLLAHKTLEFVHRDDGARLVAGYRRVMEGGPPERIEYRFRRGDGQWIWLEACPQLVRDEQGRPREFIDVARDVTARKALEAELTAARKAAEAAAEAKTAFLANMSHELRTPITAVLGFTELLERRGGLDEESRRYVERIACGGRALLATVNDVLDFSKLEAGGVTIARAPVRPAVVAAETLALFEVEAGRKGIELVLAEQRPAPAWALGDADRLRQVLLNLLGNAVKFTGQGRVTLSVDYDAAAGEATFAVEDTGPGVPPERMERLFRRFSQADETTERQFGGTGLGLAICKALVEAMDGRIGVESEPGRGSRFWFTIALPPCAAPQDGLAEAAPAELDGRRLRVLVADDNDSNRELVRALLSNLPVEVSDAENGEAAIAAAEAQAFDLILMDLRMPVCDGRRAARAIRAGGGPNAAALIVAFSADGETDLRGEDATLFDGRLPKPLRPADLLDALAAAAEAAEVADASAGRAVGE